MSAADVAEPEDVLVALHLADELRAVGSKAGEDGVDVVHDECEVAQTRGVGRLVPVVVLA
jgi:hypothetical protein